VKRFLTILVLALGSSAHAGDWPAAKSYLSGQDCTTDECRFTRETWAENYAGAIANEYQGQRNVSFCLSTGCDGAVKVNTMLGCAWRFVILERGHFEADASDTANLKHFCGSEFLDKAGRSAAEAQAKRVLGMLAAR
jgi:hypothetical protein